jgi:hypothetical protein
MGKKVREETPYDPCYAHVVWISLSDDTLYMARCAVGVLLEGGEM